MTRAGIVILAKEIVLKNGAVMCGGDNTVDTVDYYLDLNREARPPSLADLEALYSEVGKQANRVYRFLGFEPEPLAYDAPVTHELAGRAHP